MKKYTKFAVIILMLVFLVLTVISAVKAGWGYQSERALRQAARQFTKELRAKSIANDMSVTLFEDGSFIVSGCLVGAPCDDN